MPNLNNRYGSADWTQQSLALDHFSCERKHLNTGGFYLPSSNSLIQFPAEQTYRSQYMDIMVAYKLR